jgi:hypothetical protein
LTVTVFALAYATGAPLLSALLGERDETTVSADLGHRFQGSANLDHPGYQFEA